jgi:EAL domain-containing protein (putative c-di-GMP-specific phosphodiesterase class I)
MALDNCDRVIVRSTIDMAHALGLTVVAEGVESESALDLLSTFGCDEAQGPWISPPREAEDFIQWLRKFER